MTLEAVMELDDAVPTAGLNPTDTTWAQVQAVGQVKAAAQFDYTRDIKGSVLWVDIAAQSPRFESPARQRGYEMEWYKLDGSGNGAMTHDGPRSSASNAPSPRSACRCCDEP